MEVAVSDFVDHATDGALPEIDKDLWSVVTQYRVRLATGDRRWAEAERLQRMRLELYRNRAGSALAAAPKTLGADERYAVRSLAACLHDLGQIQRVAGEASCAESYRESLRAAEAIGDTFAQAICAFNLGHAYTRITDLRDLDEAERWLRHSLDLRAPGDSLGRGKNLVSLGNVAVERFEEARAARRPVDEFTRHLTEAVDAFKQALAMLPEQAVTDRGVTHNQLGLIFSEIGNIDLAFDHYRQSIRYREQAGDTFGAGQTRFNVALVLLRAGRLADARSYAMAALANFESFGNRAADDIQKTQRLIQDIEQAAAKGGSEG
jgi:tetratricopeptide (TPR) repeat protein